MEVLKSIINWELYHEVINNGKKPKIETEYNINKFNRLEGFNLISDVLPEKNRDVIAFDSDGNKYYCYRPNEDDMIWLDSIKQKRLSIDVFIWRYEDHPLWI